MSSYGVALLIVAFFQEMEFSGTIQNFSIRNVGVLLRLFFEFYSIRKLQCYEIRPFLPGTPMTHSPLLAKGMMNGSIVVVDPLNGLNNVTRSTFNVERLESLFVFLFFAIHQKSETGLLKHLFETSKVLFALNHN